jgi:hypothetical protein
MTLPAPSQASMASISRQRDLMGNAYQGQSRGVFGWVDPSGGNFETATRLLNPDMVRVIMGLAQKIDDTFTGLGINGAPPRGIIASAASNLIEHGFLPVFLRAPPSWITGHNDGVLSPIWLALTDQGSKINGATLASAQGDLQARVAEANEAARSADALLRTARAIASMGIGDLYKAVKPGFDRLAARIEAEPFNPDLALARSTYPAMRALMTAVSATLREFNLMPAGMGAMPVVVATAAASLGTVAGWVTLGTGVAVGVGGTLLTGGFMGAKKAGGFLFWAALAAGGYYAYKKGYLAKIGLKPKGV